MPLRPDASPPAPRAKRHHPARGARAGALAASCVATVGISVAFARLDASRSASAALDALPAPIAIDAAATTTAPATTVAADASTVGASAATPTSAATTAVAPTTAATATVSAFNGDLVNTPYGPVQVQVQVANGRINDVAVVAYPDFDGKSQRINARALPELRSEVLTAQSARIDTVSGATYTSMAYERSLQSAIDATNAAGVTAIS
jgi:uncharacterized protein with FMN-binding domain